MKKVCKLFCLPLIATSIMGCRPFKAAYERALNIIANFDLVNLNLFSGLTTEITCTRMENEGILFQNVPDLNASIDRELSFGVMTADYLGEIYVNANKGFSISRYQDKGLQILLKSYYDYPIASSSSDSNGVSINYEDYRIETNVSHTIFVLEDGRIEKTYSTVNSTSKGTIMENGTLKSADGYIEYDLEIIYNWFIKE